MRLIALTDGYLALHHVSRVRLRHDGGVDVFYAGGTFTAETLTGLDAEALLHALDLIVSAPPPSARPKTEPS